MKALLINGPSAGTVMDVREPHPALAVAAVQTPLSFAIGEAWGFDTTRHIYHRASVGDAGVVYAWEHERIDGVMADDFANDPDLWP